MAKNKKPVLKNAGEVGSVKELKKSLKRGGGGGYLKRIPADGLTVRFLTEPDKFVKYFEHYDPNRDDNRYFPCTEDCAGCDEGLSASKRYLVNAVDVQENKVVPLVLPASLVGSLTKKYDKFGTLVDRDYELTKEGTGLDTEYDALYDQPKKIKLDRYETLDLLAVLTSQLDGGDTDDDDDDDDDDDKPVKKGKSKKDAEPDNDEGDDDEPVKRTKDKAGKKKPLKKSK